MSSFTTKLELSELGLGAWETKRDFYYWHGTPDKLICIPAGFETDGATIPQSVQWLLKKDGPYIQAAVLHDWLHCQGGMTEIGFISRSEADDIFLEAMKILKVNVFIRNVMYFAVKSFSLLHGNIYKSHIKRLDVVKILDRNSKYFKKEGILLQTPSGQNPIKVRVEHGFVFFNPLKLCKKLLT